MGADLRERETTSDEIIPYERGTISFKEIAKSALTRFLPASLLSMAGIGVGVKVSMSGAVLALVGGVLGFAGLMAVGFGVGLLGLRRWLYPDAEVSGRRAVLAGLLSPLALFVSVALSSGLNRVQVVGVLFAVGLLLAVGMFFAWLSPTPEEMRSVRRLAPTD